jgi:hypothetical protein
MSQTQINHPDNVIGNPLGPIVPGAGNVIAHNKGAGVVIGSSITDAGTVNNTVRANSIFLNGGLGIDLGNDGVTRNHRINPATGPSVIVSVLKSLRANLPTFHPAAVLEEVGRWLEDGISLFSRPWQAAMATASAVAPNTT